MAVMQKEHRSCKKGIAHAVADLVRGGDQACLGLWVRPHYLAHGPLGPIGLGPILTLIR